MADFLIEELRSAVARSNRKPLLICGAGVSIAATSGSAPDWKKLITSGTDRALALDPRLATWHAYSKDRLDSADLKETIQVADELTLKLGGSKNAEFQAWIREQVGNLSVDSSDLLEAIFALQCPVATTNYDSLLTDYSGQQPINWNNHDETARLLKGECSGILYLHGHWRAPESVVRGTMSYADLNQDQRRVLIQQLSALDRPSVLIGCSADGLSDPDFAQLDQFITTWQGVAERRYWLVRSGDGTTGDYGPKPDHQRRLYPVPFGNKFADLVPFLSSLSTDAAAPPDTTPTASGRSIDRQQPRPEIFGRAREVEQLVRAIGESKHAFIAGGPGIGKTALATVAMYDPSIMARFGERRYFVTYETASEPRELLARVVEALGLAPSGDEASLLRQIETSTDSIPAALLLDNLDPLFDANRAEAERLLQLVAQLPNLVLLGTIRGVAPSVPGAVIIEDLAKLSVASAERAFLSVAGEALASDPDLSSLLVALDGHALSIRIVAAQAQGLPSLAGIREAWEEEHAAMLRHPSEDEGRLTSVRASLAISLKSKRLKKAPIARRLLALLAQLPAGLAEPDVRALLGERGLVSRTKAREAVTVVHQLRLVERRPDQRLRMLTPLRESVKLDISLIAADRDRLCLHFMAIAKLGSHYATSKWTVAKTILDVEADNLDPVCLIAAQSDITSDRLYRALVGLCRFVNVVGSGGLKSVYFAHDLYIQEHMYMEAAAITSELGDMAYARSRFDEAHTLFMESYKLSISSGNKLAQANALYGIGDVETALSRHQEAINNFGKALVLYRSISDGNGVANCLFRLGMIASREGEEEKAKASLREAAALYTKCASPLGRGNCEMMLSRFDPETAEACLLAVQSVFRELGAPLSYVSCLIRLGENALQNNETGKAIEWFKEAQALSRPNGNVSGEAHAMIREGQAHRAIGDEYAANMLIEKGFKLWWAVTSERDRTYEGWQALEKYLLNRFSGDSGAARDVIRCKWNPVGRKDLVEDWVDFEPRVSG